MNRLTPAQIQTLTAIGCLALLGASLWSPPYPREQWLQHIPTALAIGALLLAARRHWLSNFSAACLAAMLALHIVGARWIYSYVPYEQWCDQLLGSGPREWFGWERNHYDRLVHFAFGLLVAYPLVEGAMRYGGMNVAAAILFAWLGVAGTSAMYEVVEWALAVIAAPEMAERYNGQQGDPWDAQKDMGLAIAGSTVALAAIWRSRRVHSARGDPS